jgi:hypothetical protein
MVTDVLDSMDETSHSIEDMSSMKRSKSEVV